MCWITASPFGNNQTPNTFAIRCLRVLNGKSLKFLIIFWFKVQSTQVDTVSLFVSITLHLFFLPHVIKKSVHYKTLSTTYVVEPKILHYTVHILQSNIPMNILQSYVHITVKWYLRKSSFYICWFESFQSSRLFFFKLCGYQFVWVGRFHPFYRPRRPLGWVEV